MVYSPEYPGNRGNNTGNRCIVSSQKKLNGKTILEFYRLVRRVNPDCYIKKIGFRGNNPGFSPGNMGFTGEKVHKEKEIKIKEKDLFFVCIVFTCIIVHWATGLSLDTMI